MPTFLRYLPNDRLDAACKLLSPVYVRNSKLLYPSVDQTNKADLSLLASFCTPDKSAWGKVHVTFCDNSANCTQQEINKKSMRIMDKNHFGVAGAVCKGIGSFSMQVCSLPCLYMSHIASCIHLLVKASFFSPCLTPLSSGFTLEWKYGPFNPLMAPFL